MNITKLNSAILFLLISSLLMFSACSGDEEVEIDCLPGVEELSSGALGTYSGLLTLNGTEVVNVSGTAELTTTGCKTYQLQFSDDVQTLSNLRFLASADGDVFTYVNTNATTTVIIDGEGKLTVAKTDAPVITFTGTK